MTGLYPAGASEPFKTDDDDISVSIKLADSDQASSDTRYT